MRRQSSWLGSALPSVLSQSVLGAGGGKERGEEGAGGGPIPHLCLDLGVQQGKSWALVPALPFIYYVTLGKCFNLSGLSFLICTMGRLPVMILKTLQG